MKTPDHPDAMSVPASPTGVAITDPAGTVVIAVAAETGGEAGSTVRRCVRTLGSVPSRILLVLIRLYQRTLSPALPALLGPACGCRFYPSCSQYAAEALKTHGFWLGVVLSARRLLRCTPLHPGGYDPVPVKRINSPICARRVAGHVSS